MKSLTLVGSTLISLLFSFNSYATKANEEKRDKKEKAFQVKLEVVSKSSLGSFKESIEISEEHTGASVSLYGHHIDDYIRSFGGSVGCTDFVATLAVRFSNIAYITRRSVLGTIDDLNEKRVDVFIEMQGDKTIKEKLDLINQIADSELDKAFAPLAGQLSADEIKLLKVKARPDVLDAIANSQGFNNFDHLDLSLRKLVRDALPGARKEFFDNLHQRNARRLKYLQHEVMIRSLFVGLGKCFAGGKVFAYGKIGKFHLGLSGEHQDRAGSTTLDQLRPERSVVQAGMKSMTTTAGNIGFAYKLTDDITIQSDFYFFHDVPPVTGAQNYITQVLELNDDEYEKHKNFWKINSIAARILMKSRHADVYFSLGTFDGKESFGVGLILRLTPLNQFEILKESQTSILIDYVQSNRGYVKNAFSIFLTHERKIYKRPITFYIGYQEAKQSRITGAIGTEADYTDYIIGVKGRIWSKQYFNERLLLSLTLFLEGVHRNVKDSKHLFEIDAPVEGLGYNAGLRFYMEWN